uniref:Uncharacterized protein n=1 Tax=Quercus lobata TaxID=97700 RepID=A0A7N2M9D1_QUELO
MAFNGAEKLTTLSGLEEPTPQTNNSKEDGLKRRMYHTYCKSASSLANSVFPKANGTAPTPLSESISAKLEPAYKQQMALVKLVLAQMTKNQDLEAADLDGDRVVNSSEYILYKVKEMGKITQEDISLAMKDFEDLDQSGS